MTELTAPKSPLTANEFADEIRQALKYTQGVTPEQAKTADVYVATATVVTRQLMNSGRKTQRDKINGDTRAVGYLSAEFLMGKQLLEDDFLVGDRVFYGRNRMILQRQILPAGGKGAVIRICRSSQRFQISCPVGNDDGPDLRKAVVVFWQRLQ